MEELKDKSIKDLAIRLNEITVRKDELDIEIYKLATEYNEIVQELWKRIPSLKADPNLELKKVRGK